MPKPTPKSLLIVSRDTLLDAEKDGGGERFCRLLATINRKGCHLLITAPEPDQWLPTRGRVDRALLEQRRLQEAIQNAGGDLEGIYYVPRSLLTQNRNREGALQDILSRYGLNADAAVLVSSSVPFLKAAERLSIETRAIAEDAPAAAQLEQVLQDFAERL